MQRDRRAGGDLAAGALVLEHAGEDLHRVRLPALGDEAARARAAPVQPVLDVRGRQLQAGRAAVHDAAERRPMALAPGGDAEKMAERVVGHASRGLAKAVAARSEPCPADSVRPEKMSNDIPPSPSQHDTRPRRAPADDDAFARGDEPFALFGRWFEEAKAKEPNDPNAMALATVDAAGLPDVRMVLLKDFDARGFMFYTNTESAKGARAGRQSAGGADLPLEEPAPPGARARRWSTPVSDAEADAYFATPRPRRADRRLGLRRNRGRWRIVRAGKAHRRVRAKFGAGRGAAPAALERLSPGAAVRSSSGATGRSACTTGWCSLARVNGRDLDQARGSIRSVTARSSCHARWLRHSLLKNGRRAQMLGLMQDWPMTLDRFSITPNAIFPDREVVTRSVEGPIERTTYAAMARRSRSRSRNALIDDAASRWATASRALAWNTGAPHGGLVRRDGHRRGAAHAEPAPFARTDRLDHQPRRRQDHLLRSPRSSPILEKIAPHARNGRTLRDPHRSRAHAADVAEECGRRTRTSSPANRPTRNGAGSTKTRRRASATRRARRASPRACSTRTAPTCCMRMAANQSDVFGCGAERCRCCRSCRCSTPMRGRLTFVAPMCGREAGHARRAKLDGAERL